MFLGITSLLLGQFDMIAPVPLEQCWRICLNRLHDASGSGLMMSTQQNNAQQNYAHVLGEIVSIRLYVFYWCVYGVNSLAPGKFVLNFRYVILKLILVIDGWGISCEIALIWMSLDFTDDQSTLVQVMAWCRQATSHYLSQCWPRSLSPYGVTRPRWVI